MSKTSEEANDYFAGIIDRLRDMNLNDKSEHLLQRHLDNITTIMEEATKRHREGGMSTEEARATDDHIDKMINGMDVHTKKQLMEFLERTGKVN